MLQGKTILITGASGGIGSATARLAKTYGARVIVHGRDEKKLKALAKELDGVPIACDVTDQAEVKRAVADALHDVKQIDSLVNCAGIAVRKPFLETSDDDWWQTFNVNLLGIVHFCQAVIPIMKEHGGGHIVNIASIRGHAPLSGMPVYSASKAAVINLTSVLAKNFAPDITVNAVSPGFTNTEMSKVWDDKVWQQVKSNLLARAAEPKEVAEAILFLASDRASFITGQTLLVDGGYSVSGK